jgi:hypothetical protein
MFYKYHMDAKDIKWFLKWWRKQKTMFPIVAFWIKIYTFFLSLKFSPIWDGGYN